MQIFQYRITVFSTNLDPFPPSTPIYTTTVTTAPIVEEAKTIETVSSKKVTWNTSHTIFLPPLAITRLRERLISKHPIDLEFSRDLLPRFAHVVDTLSNKYKGKLSIDAGCLLFPRVIGLKARVGIDPFERPNTSDEVKGKKGKDEVNFWKTIGTGISLEFQLEKPLLNRKKLLPVF